MTDSERTSSPQLYVMEYAHSESGSGESSHEHSHEPSRSSARASTSQSGMARLSRSELLTSRFNTDRDTDIDHETDRDTDVETDRDIDNSPRNEHSHSHSRPIQLHFQLVGGSGSVSGSGCNPNCNSSASPSASPTASPYRSPSPSASPRASPSPCPPSPSAGLSSHSGHVALMFLERQQQAIHANKHIGAPSSDTWTNPHTHASSTDQSQPAPHIHSHSHSHSTVTDSPSPFSSHSRSRCASLSVAISPSRSPSASPSDACVCGRSGSGSGSGDSSSRSLGASPANWNAFSLKTRYRYRRIHRKASPNNMVVPQPRSTLEIIINPAEKPNRDPDQDQDQDQLPNPGHEQPPKLNDHQHGHRDDQANGSAAASDDADGSGSACDATPSPVPQSPARSPSRSPVMPSPPSSPANRLHHRARSHSMYITNLVIPEPHMSSASALESPSTTTTAPMSASSDMPVSDSASSVSSSACPSPLPPSSPSPSSSSPGAGMSAGGGGSWLQRFRRLKARFHSHSKSVDLSGPGAEAQLAQLAQQAQQAQPLPRTESGAIPTIKTFHPSPAQQQLEQQPPKQDHDNASAEDSVSSDLAFHGSSHVPRRVARARGGHGHGHGHGHIRRKSTPVLPSDLSATLAGQWRMEQRTYAQQQSPIKRRWEPCLSKENQLATQAWDPDLVGVDAEAHAQDGELVPHWTKHESQDKDECESSNARLEWNVEKPMPQSLWQANHEYAHDAGSSPSSSSSSSSSSLFSSSSSSSCSSAAASTLAPTRTLLPSVLSMNPNMRPGTPSPKTGSRSGAGAGNLSVNPTLKHKRSQSVCSPAGELPLLEVQVAVMMLSVPRSPGLTTRSIDSYEASTGECGISPLLLAGSDIGSSSTSANASVCNTPGSNAMNCRRLHHRRSSLKIFLEPELLSSFRRK